MTTTDPKALRSLAEAATPGPWEARGHAVGFPGTGLARGEFHVVADTYEDPADARYIAAVSPDVVLALLDRLEAAERERDEWKQASETHLRYLSAWSTWSTEVVYELDGHPKGGQLGHGPSRRCIYEGMRRFKQRAETAERDFRAVAEAIGIMYEPSTGTSYPGPVDAVVAHIRETQDRAETAETDRDEARAALANLQMHAKVIAKAADGHRATEQKLEAEVARLRRIEEAARKYEEAMGFLAWCTACDDAGEEDEDVERAVQAENALRAALKEGNRDG